MPKPAHSYRPACLILALAGTFALAACSPQGTPAPAAPSASAQAAANEAAANQELQLYQQSLAAHRDDLAAPLGEEIEQKYPGTAAAAEVQKTLPQIEAASKAKVEHARLAGLWYYQTANVDGMQSTASTYSEPRDAASVRLVLRRHVKWGESVYLFAPDGSKGFVCKGNCNVVMRFDGKREIWKAYLPPTGEPAMFIKNEQRFIAAIQKTKVIEMDIILRDRGKRTLKFEVGGYDSAKFLPTPGRRK